MQKIAILGPLLFLLYINDLQNSITNSDLRLFADDTAVFLHGDDPETVTADANNEIKGGFRGGPPGAHPH